MSYLGLLLLLICFLSAGTLFFSVNSFALRMFSRARLQDAFKALKKEETKAEELSDSLAEKTEKLILTCGLYRLIFNICIFLLLLAGFTGARQGKLQVGDYLPAFVIAVVIFSLFSLALPYAWAKYAAEKILSRTYRLLCFFATVVFPILCTFRLCDGLVRRLVGVAQTTSQEQHEEFLSELEQHRIEGAVDEEEQEMIENVLELSETTADEIMTPRTDIVAVEVSYDLQTVLDTITSAGHSRVPVYEDSIDNIVGFIYAKDLLTQIGNDPADFNLRGKIRQAYFVPETKPLRVLLHEFQNQKLHIAVVLDEYGGTAGIVTIEDILEELVGEITDEYEKIPQQRIKKIDKDTIEVDARVYVDDLNDEFDLNLPEDEDYDTVGGFVFSHLGYIPKTGESFDYRNLKFTIASAEARLIKRIRIRTLSEGISG